MKSLIILVLLAALVAGLFISKPTQADFTVFIKTQNAPAQPQTMGDLGKTILGGIIGDAQAATLVYDDHVLWATEDKDGQAQYIGAFGHWWKKSSATTTTPAAPAKS